MESGPLRRIGEPFDPDDPATGAGEDVPEGRVWGAGGRNAPHLIAAPRSPGRRRDPQSLSALAPRTRPPALARERTLPVPTQLATLLPEGLRRGSTVAVTGPGATSLALAAVAEASAAGSWIVAVGVEDLGLAAAAEFGVTLERLAVVAPPPPADWGTVVAALVGAVDVVLVAPRERVQPSDLRRLEARSRERGSVLVQLGDPARWPTTHDLVLVVRDQRWLGVGAGHGRLAARRVVVEAVGRREAARPRRVELLLPGGGGRLEATVGEHLPVAWAGSDIEAGVADAALRRTDRGSLREVG